MSLLAPRRLLMLLVVVPMACGTGIAVEVAASTPTDVTSTQQPSPSDPDSDDVVDDEGADAEVQPEDGDDPAGTASDAEATPEDVSGGIGAEVADPVSSVGQCFSEDQLLLVGGATVDCASEHIAEVYAVTLLPDPAGAPLPSEASLQEQASDYCNATLADVTGVAGQTSAISVRFFRPTPASWLQGDREIACFLEYPELTDRPLSEVNPLRDFGRVSVYALEPGDCLVNDALVDVVSLDWVPCSEPHRYEVFATTVLTGDAFPGDAEIRQIASGYCQGQFGSYSSVDDATLSLESAGPTEFTWTELDDRLLVCLVRSPQDRIGSVADG